MRGEKKKARLSGVTVLMNTMASLDTPINVMIRIRDVNAVTPMAHIVTMCTVQQVHRQINK